MLLFIRFAIYMQPNGFNSDVWQKRKLEVFAPHNRPWLNAAWAVLDFFYRSSINFCKGEKKKTITAHRFARWNELRHSSVGFWLAGLLLQTPKAQAAWHVYVDCSCLEICCCGNPRASALRDPVTRIAACGFPWWRFIDKNRERVYNE